MLLPLVFALVLQAPYFQFPSCAGGEMWKFVVRERDVERIPWHDTDAAPPLAPRAAVRSARELLRRMGCRGADAWELHQIALQPIAGVRDAWVYLVEFTEPRPRPKANSVVSVLPRVATVVVLLDGTAVTPSAYPVQPPR